VTNPTSTPLTISVGQESFLRSFNDTRLLVNPADTGNTYYVASEAFSCCQNPNVAEVMAGPNAAVPVSTVQFRSSNSDISYQWNTVTIPAGQTVIFMHFALQHDPSDNAGLKAQAVALANLSDPNALVGMSDAEKSQVVNFSIPATTGSLFPATPDGFMLSDLKNLLKSGGSSTSSYVMPESIHAESTGQTGAAGDLQ
jgi:plastocyanin